MGPNKENVALSTHKKEKIIKIGCLEPRYTEFILYMYPSNIRLRRNNAVLLENREKPPF